MPTDGIDELKDEPRPAGSQLEPASLRAGTFMLDATQFLVVSYELPDAMPKLPAMLTAAEQAVASALLRGGSYAEIARERATSVRTVANQVASTFRKLRVASRIDLARAVHHFDFSTLEVADAEADARRGARGG